MAIALLEEITGNAALFENDYVSGDDLGDITWSEPEEVSTDNYSVDVQGTDTGGGTIAVTTVVVHSLTWPTPAQVFRLVVDKIRDTLCPSCSNGY